MSVQASQAELERKLHKLAEKKNKPLWILDIIAFVNGVLLLFDIGFILFVIIGLSRGRFATSETRLYYGLVTLTLAINMAALVTYIVFCYKREFEKYIWYTILNAVFVIVSLCVNVVLYTNNQILEALDEQSARARHDVNLIFFIMFIISVVNCIIIIIVNIQHKKYRVYSRSFSTTLNSTVSLSRSTGYEAESQLKNFIATEESALKEKQEIEKQLQEARTKLINQNK